jgi:hypothetical protein
VNKFKLALLTTALAASSMAMAQDKAPLIKQFIELQRPGIESLARGLVEQSYPIVRDKAVALAPDALGPLMDQSFTADELKQLVAWISSPLSKKYQELNPKMQTALTEKLVAETRSTIEPKMKTLDENVAKALGAPVGGAAPAASRPAPPAKAPAKK